MDRLRLIETPDYSGYTMLNVVDCMNSEELADFDKWFNGQTGAIGKSGEYIIYKHDLDRWLDGKAAID